MTIGNPFIYINILYNSESTESKMEKTQMEIGDYQQVMVTTVFGEITEPICNYRRCHHGFSTHGLNNHICQCQHP